MKTGAVWCQNALCRIAGVTYAHPRSPGAVKLWEESIWPLNYSEHRLNIKPHKVLPHLYTRFWVGQGSLFSG